MMPTLSEAGYTALLAQPALYELLHRPTKRGGWKRLAVGSHAEVVGAINGPGEFWVREIDDAAGLGLFEGLNATGAN